MKQNQYRLHSTNDYLSPKGYENYRKWLKKLLINQFDLSDDMATKVDVQFYADAKDAMLKALVE